MVTQAEAEEILEELSKIPTRVTKSGGTNLAHYLALIRAIYGVLSKKRPELQGFLLFQDPQSIAAAQEKDALKLETLEELRTFLFKSGQLAEDLKPKRAPSSPPKKESQAERCGDIHRMTDSENKDFEILVQIFMDISNPPWRPQPPPRPDLRTRAVRPPRASSSKSPKEARKSSSSKGKEKGTSDQEPSQGTEREYSGV
ncbi:uncharacterized protein F4812DRAFT_459703 [Daldinia caldariorum]|uniref:uncharacterized protein n=1 Tax=Daldinia caldariorum TaxID=326644 RepID=UPI0020087000|nr:uncharacterized protein F4812DRAFT_459703 [Daldinia caldariorum]KAI1467597.1 hypothetical protein F4812DRAFT_459703 [Daldinia caldariorum]